MKKKRSGFYVFRPGAGLNKGNVSFPKPLCAYNSL